MSVARVFAKPCHPFLKGASCEPLPAGEITTLRMSLNPFDFFSPRFNMGPLPLTGEFFDWGSHEIRFVDLWDRSRGIVLPKDKRERNEQTVGRIVFVATCFFFHTLFPPSWLAAVLVVNFVASLALRLFYRNLEAVVPSQVDHEIADALAQHDPHGPYQSYKKDWWVLLAARSADVAVVRKIWEGSQDAGLIKKFFILYHIDYDKSLPRIRASDNPAVLLKFERSKKNYEPLRRIHTEGFRSKSRTVHFGNIEGKKPSPEAPF